MDPYITGKLFEYIRAVRDLSMRFAIPSISEEDGFVLQSMAYAYASRADKGLLVLDLGAGIGYSTLWLVAGIAPICESRGIACKVVAVEQDKIRASYARRVLGNLPTKSVEIEVVEMNAIKYLEKLGSCEVDIAFVDIDKNEYLHALELLAHKLRPHGIALFHNAFVPRPPRTFFEHVSRQPWIPVIIPTQMGVLGAVKNTHACT